MVASTAQDIHPPLYYALLHVWIQGVGTSETSVRLLSAVCSTLAVPVLMMFTAYVGGRRAGVIAGAIGCCSPFLVYYGQETRMYALLALLSVISGYAFVRATERSPRWWLLYVLVMSAALWTHLYATLLFVALNVSYATRVLYAWWVQKGGTVAITTPCVGHSVTRPKYALLLAGHRPWLAAQIGVVLTFSPWIPVAMNRVGAYTSPGHGTPAHRIVVETMLVFSLGHLSAATAMPAVLLTHMGRDTVGFLLVLPFLITLALGLLGVWQQKWAVLPCWFFLPLLGIIAISFGKRDFLARYLMEAYPAFLILIALGLSGCFQYRKTRAAGYFFTVAVLSTSALVTWRMYSAPDFARDDNRRAVQLVAQAALPGAVVVLDADFASAFEYYAHGKWPIINLPDSIPADPSRTSDALRSFTSGASQVWLILWHDYYADPTGIVWSWLRNNWFASDYVNVLGGLKVLQFDSAPVDTMQVRDAVFGGLVQLVQYHVSTHRESDGHETLQVDLYWRCVTRPRIDYSVALHLVDGAGLPYGSADQQPAAGHLPTTSWHEGNQIHTVQQLPLLPWTAPGDYRLQVAMYDQTTMTPLPAGGPASDHRSLFLPVALASKALADPGSAPGGIRLPTGVEPVAATFDGVAELAGYSEEMAADGPVLTLYWEARGSATRPYKVFVHALNTEGVVLGTGDSEPVNGASPMTSWIAAENIRDPHGIALAKGTTVVAYEVGIYDPVSGQRMLAQLPDGQLPADRAIRLSGHS